MIQKKHLNILSLIMVGFILGWATNSFMLPHRPLKKDNPPPFDHFYKLGLNQETIQKIKIIHDEAGEKHNKLKVALNEQEKEFNKDIEITKDEQKLRNSFFSFIKKRNELEEMRFETMLNVHSYLTLDQIKKLRSFGPPGSKDIKR